MLQTNQRTEICIASSANVYCLLWSNLHTTNISSVCYLKL